MRFQGQQSAVLQAGDPALVAADRQLVLLLQDFHVYDLGLARPSQEQADTVLTLVQRPSKRPNTQPSTSKPRCASDAKGALFWLPVCMQNNCFYVMSCIRLGNGLPC